MKTKFLFIKILLVFATFSLATISADAQKFDRGLEFDEAPLFMPKNQFILGGTFSYQKHSFDDYKFLLLDNVNMKGYTLSVTPYLYYSFYRNMAAGIRFSYKRNLADVKATDIVINEDMQFNIDDLYAIQHTYYGSLSYRYYVPLLQSRIFALFSDISMNVGAGQGKIMNKDGDVVNGTYQKILDLGINVIPGLIFFVTNEMAIEASVNILDLAWKHVSQTSNQVYIGSYTSSGLDFKIKLFSINIGVDFVIPLRNNSN